MICCDNDLLSEIFIDMIRNAYRGIKEPEILYIKTFEGEDHIHVDFRIRRRKAAADHPDEFSSPFNERQKNKGLSLSYRLLKEMGGFLSFTQEKEHNVFTISLSKSAGPNSG